jgi:hypothetical protein
VDYEETLMGLLDTFTRPAQNGHGHPHDDERPKAPTPPYAAPNWWADARLEIVGELEHICTTTQQLHGMNEEQATRIDKIAKRVDRLWGAVERLELFFLKNAVGYPDTQTHYPPEQLEAMRRRIREMEARSKPIPVGEPEEDL